MAAEIDKFLEEVRYNHEIVQMIRGLMFWIVEPGESRDRKGLVVLAEYAKQWAEGTPPRLTDDAKEFFIKWCDDIIAAGAKSDGPEMPAAWQISIGGVG